MKVQIKAQAQKGKDRMATAPVLVMKPQVKEFGKDFVERTVLLRVSLGLPGFSKKVSKGSDVVQITSGDEDLYKTQQLLLDSPELDAVQKLDNSFRLWLYANFTQFSIGVFVVPKGMVDLIEKKVAEFVVERRKLIKIFASKYSTRIDEMEPRLKKGFDRTKYPPIKVVVSNFTFTYNYFNFETPGQLKGINPDIFAREQKKAESLFRNVAQEFQTALRVNFAEMVKKLQGKLTNEIDTATGKVKQKRIHESAVEKLQEFVSTFDLRNAMNDTALKAEVDKVRKLIKGVDTEALRTTDSVRDTIRKGMEQVTAKLETLVTDAPVRKFRFES